MQQEIKCPAVLFYSPFPVELFSPWIFCGVFISLQGTLKGFDQTINLILDESHERVYSNTQGVEQVVLGLYIIRGDNM